MESNETDLHKKLKKLELEELEKYKFSPDRISAFETLLLDVYGDLRPREAAYQDRENLVHVFDAMAKRTYGSNGGFPTVEAFGSFVMDLFTAKSDLDLSLNFSAEETSSFSREKKISLLRKFAKILYVHQRKGKVSGVLPILRARVPVVKVVDRGTGIECDISAENRDGISRSLIINLICLVDERFRILSFLMKAWAKAHDINSTKDHTLSSLSIILLVAFHLQTRDPPIFPPFSALLRDGPHPISVENIIHGFKQFGRENKESVAELFIALLFKLSSVRSSWELGLCASAHEGFWISKTWKSNNIGVEDFLDRSQNCARAVGKVELLKIYDCIDRSLSHLVQFMNGQMEGSELKTFLFGPVSLHAQDENVALESRNPKRELPKPKRRLPHNDSVAVLDNAKRIRHTEPVGKPAQIFSQIPSGTTLYPKHSVPLNHHSTPGQNYGLQDHLKPPLRPYHLVGHTNKPQLPFLYPALTCGPQYRPELFDIRQHHYGSHVTTSLVGPQFSYGPEHHPPHPLVPLGQQSGCQAHPPLVSHDFNYRPFHDLQPSVSQSFHMGSGLRPMYPMPLVNEPNTIQLGYHNQYTEKFVSPFHQR